MKMNFFKRVEGDIRPGHLAKSSDINQIQTNIEDATREMMKVLHGVVNTSFILGSEKDSFVLTPAPKEGGRYIDTKNLITDESAGEYVSINKHGFRQPIWKSKSSCYAIIVKLKNTHPKLDVDAICQLKSTDGRLLKQTKITIPKNTKGKEFVVVFDQDHLAVQPGRDPNDLVQPDAISRRFLKDDEIINDEEIDDPTSKNNSVGAPALYFVIKPLGLSETDQYLPDHDGSLDFDNEFGILVDKEAHQGGFLETVDFGGTEYYSYTDENGLKADLYYKDVYSNSPTYLCTGGEAIINGERVLCMDTHISVSGASTYGNVKSYICLNNEGFLEAINSQAYTNEKEISYEKGTEVTDDMLLIGIITTYVGDSKQPHIDQDDTNMITRKRSHHERLRRLEKEILYQRDITMPSRLKYNLSGEDIINKNPDAILSKDGNCVTTPDFIERSKYFLSSDSKGNIVVKSMESEVMNLNIDFLNEYSTTDSHYVDDTHIIASNNNVIIDKNKGIVQLDKTKNKGNSGIGTTDAEAKLTTSNPWDDDKKNRPTTKVSELKPTERVFTVQKDKVGANVWSSEFPAMTFYTKNAMKLKSITVPVTKFKNIESVRFYIWKRQTPNDKKNTVWLEKLVYTSKSFSLENAKNKDGYQILDEPLTIDIDKGLSLEDHQYIIFILATPKSGSGSVYVETYKPESSKDFLIRYYGSADASHFLLKDRYYEIWYNPASITAEIEHYTYSGSITSGAITWDEDYGEPVNTISYDGNINTPTGCSAVIQVNCGAGWVDLPKTNTAYPITGGERTFKWRALLNSNGKDTPKISYDDSKKYALSFKVTRGTPQQSNANIDEENFNNNCITTNTLYPGDILEQYVGDDGFDGSSRFSKYEFLRLWGANSDSENLIIDVAASDIRGNLSGSNKTPAPASKPGVNEFDVFNMFYADLTLDDFTQDNVDYSNYDDNIEYDEHNLRVKIDTNQAYNDDDVLLANNKELRYPKLAKYDANNSEGVNFTYSDNILVSRKRLENGIKEGELDEVGDESETISSSSGGVLSSVIDLPTANIYSSSENRSPNLLLAKATFDNYKNFTNYSGLKLNYTLNGKTSATDVKVSGLGLYISSGVETEAPTNKDDIVEVKDLHLPDVLTPDSQNASNELIAEYAANEVIFKEGTTINDVTYYIYYQYVPFSDENSPSGISYKKTQYHNVKSSTIFYLPSLTIGSGNEITFSIDLNNINFEYVKEIGLITLTNEGISYTFSSNSVSESDKIYKKVSDYPSDLKTGYYKDGLFYEDEGYTTPMEWEENTFYQNLNSLSIEVDVYQAVYSNGNGLTSAYSLCINQVFGVVRGISLLSDGTKDFIPAETSVKAFSNTDKMISNTDLNKKFNRFNIHWNNDGFDKSGQVLYYLNNDTITTDFKHFAIQFATDTWLPKNSLTIDLCSERDGKNPVYSLNLPTLNYLFYSPNQEYRGGNVYKGEFEYITKEALQKKVDSGTSISTETVRVNGKDYEVTKKYRKESDSYLYPRGFNIGDTKYAMYITCKKSSNGNVYEITDKNGSTFKYNEETIKYVMIGFGDEEIRLDNLFSEYNQDNNKFGLLNENKWEGIDNLTANTGPRYKMLGESEEKVGVHRTDSNIYLQTNQNPIQPSAISISVYNKKGENLTTAYKKDDTGTRCKIKKVRTDGDIGIYEKTAKEITDTNVAKVAISFKVPNRVTDEPDECWLQRVSSKPTPMFSQIYKKIDDDQQIKSIRISTTDKFYEFVKKIKEQSITDVSPDIDEYITFFIKNISLHEAEHIPLYHPNIRMKLYGKVKDGSKDVDSPGVRKIGAVIEYK